MNYNSIVVSNPFARRLKKYVKKFPSLKNEMKELQSILLKDPEYGESLGDGLYKIRISSKSKGKGKSGGFRVITYVVDETPKGFEITLILIYDKSEISNVLKSRLIKIVREIIG